MFNGKNLLKKIVEMYYQDDYTQIVEILKEIKTTYPNEYVVWFIQACSESSVVKKIPLVEFASIADYEINPDLSNGITLIRDWALISPKVAHEKFYEEFYPSLQFEGNFTRGIISTYAYSVLPYLLEGKELEEIKLILSEFEKVVYEKLVEEKSYLLTTIMRLYKNYGIPEESIRIININNHLLSNSSIWADIYGLALASNDSNITQQSIVSIQSYINQIENNKNIEYLLPSIQSFLRKVLFYITNVINSEPSDTTTNNAWKQGFEKIVDSNDVNGCLILAREVMSKDIISDKVILKEWKELLKGVKQYETFSENTDEFYKALDLLNEKYLYQILDESSHKIDRVLEEKGILLQPYNIELADKLILESMTVVSFEELKKFEGTIKFLRTGEWVWYNQLKNMSENQKRIDNNFDYTFLVASHFKAVETFLHEKILFLSKGKTIILEPYYPNGSKKYIKVRRENERFEKLTLGNYYNYIATVAGAKDTLKREVDPSTVKKYLEDWTNSVRNSKLHKHAIDSFYSAEEIRKKTLEVLSNLIRDLK